MFRYYQRNLHSFGGVGGTAKVGKLYHPEDMFIHWSALGILFSVTVTMHLLARELQEPRRSLHILLIVCVCVFPFVLI